MANESDPKTHPADGEDQDEPAGSYHGGTATTEGDNEPGGDPGQTQGIGGGDPDPGQTQGSGGGEQGGGGS